MKNVPRKSTMVSKKKSRQHTVARPAPYAFATKARAYFDISTGKHGSVIVKGQDLVDSLNTEATPDPCLVGTVLTSIPLAPDMFDGSRLQSFGKLFDRFKFVGVRVHYVPIVSATQAGSIIICFDRDPADSITTEGIEAVRTVFGWEGTVSGNVWSPLTFSMPTNTVPLEPLFTDGYGEERLRQQGRLYVVSNSSLPASLALGQLYIEYVLELSVPQNSDIPNAAFNLSSYPPATGDMLVSTEGIAPVVTGDIPIQELPNGKHGFILKPGTYHMDCDCLNPASGNAASVIPNPTVLGDATVTTVISETSGSVGEIQTKKWYIVVKGALKYAGLLAGYAAIYFNSGAMGVLQQVYLDIIKADETLPSIASWTEHKEMHNLVEPATSAYELLDEASHLELRARQVPGKKK